MGHIYGRVRGLDLGDAVHMTRDLHADHAIDGVCVAQEGPTAYQACAYLEELQGAPELGVLVVLGGGGGGGWSGVERWMGWRGPHMHRNDN